VDNRAESVENKGPLWTDRPVVRRWPRPAEWMIRARIGGPDTVGQVSSTGGSPSGADPGAAHPPSGAVRPRPGAAQPRGAVHGVHSHM